MEATPFKAAHSDFTVFFVLEVLDDRISKKIVYMTDYELSHSDNYDELLTICRNADLILFDASYLPDDYAGKEGRGHPAYVNVMRLASDCGCKKMIFCHLSQSYSDDALD